MRKSILLLLLTLTALLSCGQSHAQINKAYINYIGRVYLSDSQYQEAIEIFNTLLRVDPNAYETYFLRGVAKYNLDDLFGAEQDFTTAIEKNPVFTLAYRNRAITNMRLGNYDDALRDFQEAIDLRPDQPSSYYSRGVTYLMTQQFENAVSDFNEFIKRENRVVDAYVNRGTGYLNMQDTVRAFENFDQAVRTNREDPRGYYYRGSLLLTQKKYDQAIEDFDMAIKCDSTYLPAYFNRAIVHANAHRPIQAIEDFDTVLRIDSTNSQTYFNRAILRTQIGDYNRALEDYDQVAFYSPGNVLVYYNRAGLYAQLGNLEAAIADYTKAIDLYPDFANAYLYRSGLRYMLRDTKGARADRNAAERKISEYRTKLSDSTFSIYADTSRRFNQLMAFESRAAGVRSDRVVNADNTAALKSLFRFTLLRTEGSGGAPWRYYNQTLEQFRSSFGDVDLALTTSTSNIPTDSLLAFDARLVSDIGLGSNTWQNAFLRGITQALIKQYTNSVNTYTDAIEKEPTNAFLYLNRSTTRSEMIDFISSIDNSYQRITLESDPSSGLKNNSTRTYSYDEAIADLNKAAKLMPEFPHIYYNRANLLAYSGRLPEAYEDYTHAIALFPEFAEAYFNRGLVQIFMKDTRKGCLDLSKAGELGMTEAYELLKVYSYLEGQ